MISIFFQPEKLYDTEKTYSSEPDLVIMKDTKWKILKTKDASFDNDIAILIVMMILYLN